MKEAVRKLKIDPDFHEVTAEPHQLIVYDQGGREPYIYKSDPEQGTFLGIQFSLLDSFN